MFGDSVNYIDTAGTEAASITAARWSGIAFTVSATIGAAVTGVVALIYPSPVGEGSDIVPIYNKPPSDAHDPNGAKAPGKPGEDEGFEDAKGGEEWVPNPNPRKGGSSHGWNDKKGRVCCPTGQGGRAHGGPHWDVQLPGGGNKNIRPGQNIND